MSFEQTERADADDQEEPAFTVAGDLEGWDTTRVARTEKRKARATGRFWNSLTLSVLIHCGLLAAGISWWRHAHAEVALSSGGEGLGLVEQATPSQAQASLPGEAPMEEAQDALAFEAMPTADAEMSARWPQAMPPSLVAVDEGAAPSMAGAGESFSMAALAAPVTARVRVAWLNGGGSATANPSGESRRAGLPGEFSGGNFPRQVYPLAARRRGEQGVVRVEIEVLADGSIGEIRVASGPDFPLLRQAALDAAEKCRGHFFIPAIENGRPVRSTLTVPYQFFLK